MPERSGCTPTNWCRIFWDRPAFGDSSSHSTLMIDASNGRTPRPSAQVHPPSKMCPHYVCHAVYRIFTSIFVHAGLLHVAFNMLAFVPLGISMERRMGTVQVRLAFKMPIYTVCIRLYISVYILCARFWGLIQPVCPDVPVTVDPQCFLVLRLYCCFKLSVGTL